MQSTATYSNFLKKKIEVQPFWVQAHAAHVLRYGPKRGPQ